MRKSKEEKISHPSEGRKEETRTERKEIKY